MQSMSYRILDVADCSGAKGGTSLDQWTLSREIPFNRYGMNCQNASFRASWITRGLTAVLLITPNVGEVKLLSGLANCG